MGRMDTHNCFAEIVALDWKKNGELVIYDPWDGNIGTYTIDEAFYTGFLSAQGKGILKWVQYIV
jgi:hypothetical protein